jgi:hypothetical protein
LGGLNFYLLVAIQVFCLGIQSEKSFGKKKPFYSTPTYKNNQHISSVQGISLFKEISSAFKKIQIKDPSGFYNLKTLLPLDIFANDVLSNIIIFGDVKLVSLKRVMNPVFMIELCKWRF